LRLNPDKVVFHPLSYVDSYERVFWFEGNIYRAVTGERVALYEQLLSDGVIQDLARRKLLIDTEATDLELDGFTLVLKHRTVPFVSYCYEWCGEMLKAAALFVLRLEEELQTYGLTLQDCHPWNVLFVGPTPVWVDLNALSPVRRGQPWACHEAFSAYFIRPLKIMAAGHERIARCLLQDGRLGGVQQCEAEAIVGSLSAKMIRSANLGATSLAKKIIPSRLRPSVRRVVQDLARPALSPSAWEPMSSVEKVAREIEKIRLVQPSTGWSSYDNSKGFPDFALTADWTDKHRSILQILAAKRPGSVLDIGSNRGWYSQLAARNGAQVVSVDRDEPSVTKLFFDVVKDHLPILPLVMEFNTLNPATVSNYPPGIAPAARLRCDMVLALALTHHLVFTHDLKFEQIVHGLSEVARKWLVVEFVGREDRHMIDSMDNWHHWYTLDNFLIALRQKFRSVEIFPSDDEHRRILLCER
jgi:hypothetical protein